MRHLKLFEDFLSENDFGPAGNSSQPYGNTPLYTPRTSSSPYKNSPLHGQYMSNIPVHGQYSKEEEMDSRAVLDKKTRMKLYHGVRDPKNVDKILKNGFDLREIHPIWTNDYAVSTLTSPKAVRAFFGNLASYDDVSGLFGLAHDARDYTRKVVESGIDAVKLDSDRGAHQVFVYNPKAIKKITLLK
jgi:hypothetical protein